MELGPTSGGLRAAGPSSRPQNINDQPSSARSGRSAGAALFAWHGWLGVNFGLLLFVVTLAGVFAVFSRELDSLVTPGLRLASPGGPMGWTEVQDFVQLAEPDAVLRSIEAPSGPCDAAVAVIDRPDQRSVRVFADPATGEILGESSGFTLQAFFRAFHTKLFFPDQAVHGTYVVGLMGFVLAFTVLTGLLFYRHWWRHLFRLRARLGWKVFVSDLHRLLGSWTLVFSAVMAVTGMWFFFKWMPFLHRAWEVREPVVSAAAGRGELLGASALVERAREALPGLAPRVFRPSQRNDEAAYVDGLMNSPFLGASATHAFLDPADGRVLQNQSPSSISGLRRWVAAADEIHFGRFGAWENLTVKALWSALGLCLPAIVLTGALISLKRSRASGGPGVAVGLVITTLILGYGAWCAFGEVASYGRIMEERGSEAVILQFPQLPPGVWVVIVGFLLIQLAAAAAWYGLALRVLRRRSPSQD